MRKKNEIKITTELFIHVTRVFIVRNMRLFIWVLGLMKKQNIALCKMRRKTKLNKIDSFKNIHSDLSKRYGNELYSWKFTRNGTSSTIIKSTVTSILEGGFERMYDVHIF